MISYHILHHIFFHIHSYYIINCIVLSLQRACTPDIRYTYSMRFVFVLSSCFCRGSSHAFAGAASGKMLWNARSPGFLAFNLSA